MLSPTGSSSRTVSAWVFPTDISNSQGQTVLQYGDSSTRKLFRFGIQNGKLSLKTYSEDLLSDSSSLTNNSWQLISVTVENTDVKFYLNGVLIGSKTLTDILDTQFGYYDENIGSASPSGSEFFSGTIDNVRIYNRAFQASELQGLYNLENPYFKDTFSQLDVTKWEIVSGTWDVNSGTLNGHWSLSQAHTDQANILYKGLSIGDDFSAEMIPDITGYNAHGFSIYQSAGNKYNINFGLGHAGQTQLLVEVRENNSTYSTVLNNIVDYECLSQACSYEVEKKGNKFTIFINKNKVGEFTDNIWNGQTRVGLRAYGSPVKYSSFALNKVVNEIENIPPVANAGTDRTVNRGTNITLDASASTDSDGVIVGYEWKEDDKVVSNNVSFITTNITNGTRTFTLTVTDDDGAVGSDSVTITFVDATTPDAFKFVDQTNVDTNTIITSNEITISGMNGYSTMSIEGGEYSVFAHNIWSAWSNSETIAINGDIVKVRHTSSASHNNSVNTVLTIGELSDTFTSTTESTDTTPDQFSITSRRNVPANTMVISPLFVITGINAPTAISIQDGEYRINNGAWTSSAGTVNNNDTVNVRHTSSSSYNFGEKLSTLTVGGVSDEFQSVTYEVKPEVKVYQPGVEKLYTVSGENTFFDIVLTAKPSSNVTVTVTSSDTSIGDIDKSEFIFTPDNWDKSQQLVVVGKSLNFLPKGNLVEEYYFLNISVDTDDAYYKDAINSIPILELLNYQHPVMNSTEFKNMGFNLKSLFDYELTVKSSVTVMNEANKDKTLITNQNFVDEDDLFANCSHGEKIDLNIKLHMPFDGSQFVDNSFKGELTINIEEHYYSTKALTYKVENKSYTVNIDLNNLTNSGSVLLGNYECSHLAYDSSKPHKIIIKDVSFDLGAITKMAGSIGTPYEFLSEELAFANGKAKKHFLNNNIIFKTEKNIVEKHQCSH